MTTLVLGCVFAGQALAEKAPCFNCTTLSGKKLTQTTLSDGRAFVVLTFFGVNCIPCQKKLAQLNEVWRDERFREKAVIYAINADGYNAEKLEKELARRNIRIDFPVVSDESQLITNLYVDGIVPLTVVIDNDFQVVMSMVGARPGMVKKMEDRILTQGEVSKK